MCEKCEEEEEEEEEEEVEEGEGRTIHEALDFNKRINK